MIKTMLKLLVSILWEFVQAVCLTICIHLVWNLLADAEICKWAFSYPISLKFDAILSVGILNYRLYNKLLFWDSWIKSTVMIVLSSVMVLIAWLA